MHKEIIYFFGIQNLITDIMLLDRFKFLRLVNDFRATVGKSEIKFSERSNFSKFSIP